MPYFHIPKNTEDYRHHDDSVEDIATHDSLVAKLGGSNGCFGCCGKKPDETEVNRTATVVKGQKAHVAIKEKQQQTKTILVPAECHCCCCIPCPRCCWDNSFCHKIRKVQCLGSWCNCCFCLNCCCGNDADDEKCIPMEVPVGDASDAPGGAYSAVSGSDPDCAPGIQLSCIFASSL